MMKVHAWGVTSFFVGLAACTFDTSGAGAGAGNPGVDVEATGFEHDSSTAATLETGATVDTAGGESTRGGDDSDGMVDDGGTSTGADACAEDNGGCDPNASCSAIGDEVSCACHRGWQGDGASCVREGRLDPLRVESPCTAMVGCGGGGPHATCSSVPTQTTGVFEGTPGIAYEVTLRVRGVVELKVYTHGTDHGHWYEGGQPVPNPWNVFRLDLGGDHHYLNHGTPGASHCVAMDFEHTLVIEGDTPVELAVLDEDACQLRNRGQGGDPIVVPGIPPAPRPFDGQFVQIDLVSALPLR